MAENNTTVEVENNTTTTEAEIETKEVKKEKKHIIIDPITRIEGHLRIEAIIDENNKIVDAYSSSTCLEVWRLLWKIETLEIVGLMAQCVSCGVCTGKHINSRRKVLEGLVGRNGPFIIPLFPKIGLGLGARKTFHSKGALIIVALGTPFRGPLSYSNLKRPLGFW